MIGEVGIWHECADPQSSIGRLLDSLERQPRDVDQARWAFDILLHQVDQVGAARDELRRRISGHLAHRIGDVVRASVLEIDHDRPIACWIAATVLGYAPQRQILPLMSSRISPALFALPSALSAAAARLRPGVRSAPRTDART